MQTKPVYVFARWQVKDGELDHVLHLLSSVVAQTIAEQGNLFYKVHQSRTEPNTLILFEGYANEAAVDAHRNSEHFQQIVSGQIVPKLEHREVTLTSLLEWDAS